MAPESPRLKPPTTPIRSFSDMGTDINESLMNLRVLLRDKLGSDKAAERWMQTGNEDLEGALPEVVINIDPDKVVRAALVARKNRT